MEFIIIILIVALVIVYFARENHKENSSYTTNQSYNRNNSTYTSNSNSDSDKLNKLKTLSDKLVLKSQAMANSLSEEGLTPQNNSIMIDVANDWETITDLYLELGDRANSLYILMGGQRQPFPTFMLCMQGFLTEVQQVVEEEMRR